VQVSNEGGQRKSQKAADANEKAVEGMTVWLSCMQALVEGGLNKTPDSVAYTAGSGGS